MKRFNLLWAAAIAALLTPLTAYAGNVIITPAPEPATLAVLGAGLVGVALAKFRRRK